MTALMPPVPGSAPAQAATKQSWLDPQWRDIHKLWSQRVYFILLAFAAAQMVLPAFMSWIPPRLFALLVILAVFGGGILRILKQKSTDL